MNLTNFEDIPRTDIFQVDRMFLIKWRNQQTSSQIQVSYECPEEYVCNKELFLGEHSCNSFYEPKIAIIADVIQRALTQYNHVNLCYEAKKQDF